MLRVKVELVPWGREEAASVIDEVLIENDGSSIAGVGPNQGGVGNYNVFDSESIGHLNMVDYPSMYACGRIEGIERTPNHRFLVAGKALAIVQEAREAGHTNARPLVDAPNTTGHGSDGEGQ